MSRPRKCRRVCRMPYNISFGPTGGDVQNRCPVIMTVDEFEAIRLIDLEGMTQEECAKNMGVARTTAQSIYSSARYKLADCLTEGKELRIDGGEYELCENFNHPCHCGHKKCRGKDSEDNKRMA